MNSGIISHPFVCCSSSQLYPVLICVCTMICVRVGFFFFCFVCYFICWCACTCTVCTCTVCTCTVCTCAVCTCTVYTCAVYTCVVSFVLCIHVWCHLYCSQCGPYLCWVIKLLHHSLFYSMNGLILDRDMSLLPCLVGLVKEGLIVINMLFFFVCTLYHSVCIPLLNLQ